MRTTTLTAAALAACTLPADAQEFHRTEGSIPVASAECAPIELPVPEIEINRNVRAAVTWEPLDAAVKMWFYDPASPADDVFGGAGGPGGYAEVEARLAAGPARSLYVCIERDYADGVYSVPAGITYTVTAGWIGVLDPLDSSPTASDWTEYHDIVYRDIIFDNYERPENLGLAESQVLPWPDPQFYIRLGGPGGCTSGSRVTVNMLHAWRMLVPVLLEQITGVPYPHRVQVGCESLPDRRGWIMVHHSTPEEYKAETGLQWGLRDNAAARIGALEGRIWIRVGSRANHFSTNDLYQIAPEIGHAMGLHHTTRRRNDSDRLMEGKSWYSSPMFLSPEEEVAARKAYRAGRGAKYCGDPDECGRGQ